MTITKVTTGRKFLDTALSLDAYLIDSVFSKSDITAGLMIPKGELTEGLIEDREMHKISLRFRSRILRFASIGRRKSKGML